jgi:uncharacterized protein involved in type VI secretion and phage assembly
MSQAQRSSKIRGVHMGLVVDNVDGNGNPGYRVKVKFPWLNDQEATYWARIAVPMAGPERGTYVLPEIDDQVLVVFEHADMERPIVIGTLWSKKQEPVEVNESSKNNTKLIKSRCGHRIIFDDKQGAEKVIIVDKTKKNKIVLDSVNKIVKIECGDREGQRDHALERAQGRYDGGRDRQGPVAADPLGEGIRAQGDQQHHGRRRQHDDQRVERCRVQRLGLAGG